MPARVLIAGAGVAALEAALALQALADDRVDVELLGAEHHFWYRPLSVAEPFALGDVQRFELPGLAVAAGARFSPGTLLGANAVGHKASTSVGKIPYEFLLIAVGAVPSPAVPGALTFRGPADSEKYESLLAEVASGQVTRLAFAVPHGAVWPLPLYELALLTAAFLAENQIEDVELSLATPETAPLEAFGPAASSEIRQLLARRGVALRCASTPLEFRDGVLRLYPEEEIEADRVVALPRLSGARLEGIPQTPGGFIAVDDYARVEGCDDVYAAGDIVDYPLKQGGIATQFADAAATSIASLVGADVEPEQVRPRPQGRLLTGGRDHSLPFDRSGFDDAVTTAGAEPAKVVSRYLTPFLARMAEASSR